MKKVLVVLNGIYTSGYVLAAAVNLAKETNSMLHALFLNTDRKGVEGNYFFPNDLALTENAVTGESIREENNHLVENHVAIFRKMCTEANVQHEFDSKPNYDFNELIKLSLYYDMILVDARADFYQYPLADVLADAHCPIVLTTSEFDNVRNIVLAYDGSPSSVHAIRMFSYLFPQWLSRKIFLVSVTSNNKAPVNYAQMQAFLLPRCPEVVTQTIAGKVEHALPDFIKSLPGHTIVVMGAYGKNAVSRVFHKSLSNVILEATSAAVFSTHI